MSDAPAGETTDAATFEDSDQPLKDEPLTEEIAFDDFIKVDLRIARIVTAERIEEAVGLSMAVDNILIKQTLHGWDKLNQANLKFKQSNSVKDGEKDE